MASTREKPRKEIKLRRGTWLVIEPKSSMGGKDPVGLSRGLELPFRHVARIGGAVGRLGDEWTLHCDRSESILRGLAALRFFNATLPSTIDNTLLPLIETAYEEQQQSFESMLSEMRNHIEDSVGEFIHISIPDEIIYPFLSGVWTVLICFSSIHDYLREYCQNMVDVCKRVLKEGEKVLASQKKKYLKEMRSYFEDSCGEWEREQRRQKAEGRPICFRHQNVHQMLLAMFLLNWDRESKRVRFPLSVIPWEDNSSFEYQQFVSDCDQLERKVSAFADETFTKTFELLEMYDLMKDL